MTKQEQDKLWAELSEESKCYYRTEYQNRLEDAKRDIEDPEGGGDLTVLTSQAIADDLEKIFGSHNLKPALTYEDILKWANGKDLTKFHKKLEAIGDLMTVAKFLNRNEDGSDWVPDLEDKENADGWSIRIYDGKIGIYWVYFYGTIKEIVYFRTEELAQQAVQILGEDVVRTALTTKY